jgi:asparagine synthase (glutamine-hydrolysing)
MFYETTLILTRTAGRTAMRITLAVLNKRGCEAKKIVVNALGSSEMAESECIEVASPQLKPTEGLRRPKSRTGASVAIGSILPNSDFSIVDISNGKLAFQGRIYSPALMPSPLGVIADDISREHEKAIRRMISVYEGDFAVIVAEPKRIVAGRDPIGVQPLYYGEAPDCAAVGSNRSILRKIGIQETQSFPPGHIGVATSKGFRFAPVRRLTALKPKQTTMETAVDTLLKMLEHAVHVRARNEKRIAVAFSGGLDSSIVAFQAKKSCSEVRLVHVSLEGQSETEEAKRAADELKLPLEIHTFREQDVATTIPKVVELVEEPDPVKTAIGIAFYWTAQKTAEAGFRVLLAGQGADELFGGYKRYAKEYCLHGEEKVRRTMLFDIGAIHESNIERDKKICGFHDVELRLPFASYAMVEFAARLPTELKLDCKLDSPRKLVLRMVAEKMGLPHWIAAKPKKAVQYGTGISSALKRLSRRRKTDVGDLLVDTTADRADDADILGE